MVCSLECTRDVQGKASPASCAGRPPPLPHVPVSPLPEYPSRRVHVLVRRAAVVSVPINGGTFIYEGLGRMSCAF